MKTTYRPEIDFLRCIAVLPVILFHLNINFLPGGFVGVDVFFVISGYLIGKLIINEIHRNEFSFNKFYERRARRLLPCLYFVIISSLIAVLFIYHPYEIIYYLESQISVIFFLSNEYFWREFNYFSPSAELAPLLHTWSLSVEEQFYFLFPIILFFIIKIKKLNIFSVFFLLTIIFFILTIFLQKKYPTPSFFSLITRSWELGAGICLAIYEINNPKKRNIYLILLSIIILFFSYLLITKESNHPGLITLAPVIATVIFIYFYDDKNIILKIFVNKNTIYIGLISYSLYLWHYPIIIFYKKINKFGLNSVLDNMIILSIIFFISIFTYHYIEKVFRDKDFISTNLFLKIVFFTSIFIVLFSLYGLNNKGYLNTVSLLKYKNEGAEKIENYKLVNKSVYFNKDSFNFQDECLINLENTNDIDVNFIKSCKKKYGKGLFILGDSHAFNLFNILYYSKKFDFILSFSRPGCRIHSLDGDCKKIYNNYFSWIENNSNLFNSIIYHQSGSYFVLDSENKPDSQESFSTGDYSFDYQSINQVLESLKNIKKNINSKIIWIGPFLEYRFDPLNDFDKPESNKVNIISAKIFKELEVILTNLSKKNKSLIYHSWSDFFYEPISSYEKSCFMFRDYDHYSTCGEKIIGNKFDSISKDYFLD